MVSDKKAEADIVVRKHQLIFSCKINSDFKKNDFKVTATLLKRFLSDQISQNVNKDTLISYALAYSINGKNISWAGNDFFNEIEFQKKLITANTALNVFSQKNLYSSKARTKIKPDNYFSIEEYVLIDLLANYKPTINQSVNILQLSNHIGSFELFLDWLYAEKKDFSIVDIFKLYNNSSFVNMNDIIISNDKIVTDFHKSKAISDVNLFFTEKEESDRIFTLNVLKQFCNIFKSDWYFFFQTLQNLEQKGLITYKTGAIILNPLIYSMPTGVLNSFQTYIDIYDFKSLVKLIRQITKNKTTLCKKCGSSLLFSSNTLFCDHCEYKISRLVFGKKISDWQTFLGLNTGQILFFSERFKNFVVLYVSQTTENSFCFSNKSKKER